MMLAEGGKRRDRTENEAHEQNLKITHFMVSKFRRNNPYAGAQYANAVTEQKTSA